MDDPLSFIPIERNIFTNRTLNMRSIQAIGYGPETTLPIDELNIQLADIKQKISTLDERIRPCISC